MEKPKLKGFIAYTGYSHTDGEHFFSDAKKTLKEIRAQYGHSQVEGYIDLSKIPAEAYLPLEGKISAEVVHS